jgi:hypothetical protein
VASGAVLAAGAVVAPAEADGDAVSAALTAWVTMTPPTPATAMRPAVAAAAVLRSRRDRLTGSVATGSAVSAVSFMPSVFMSSLLARREAAGLTEQALDVREIGARRLSIWLRAGQRCQRVQWS